MTASTMTATASAAPAIRAGLSLAARQRRRRLLADAGTWLVWAGAALAVVLYFTSGTVSLTTPGKAVSALGIVAGLVGTDLVLVMLVLAARVPIIDRTVGHDRALELHRGLGKPAFFLLLGHGVLLTAGSAMSDSSNVVSETVALFGSPDMPLAYLSIGLFVVVIVTSLVAVKRRFAFEVWWLIHLLSYAAVLTALPHELSEGGVLAEGSWQRVYWTGLTALAIGGIVAFRILEPLVQSLRHRLVVDGVERIAPDAVVLHLRGRRLDALRAEGGQFFDWRFLTPATFWHAHPLSLSAAPSGDRLRVTVRELGAGTRRLARLAPGTRVGFAGPYGVFTERAAGRDRFVLFAAGIGVTPVLALLQRLAAGPGQVTVLVRAGSDAELFHWAELRALCAARGWTLYRSVGRRAQGPQGWLSEGDARRGVTMDSVAPQLAASEVYVCGADGWADRIEAEAALRGVPATALHRERFEW